MVAGPVYLDRRDVGESVLFRSNGASVIAFVDQRTVDVDT